APDEAKVVELRTAAARRPQSAEAHAELGIALGDSGNLAEAIRELEKAVELNSGYASGFYNLGATWIKKAKQAQTATSAEYYSSLDRALAALRRAYQLDPALRHVHDLLGWLYQQIGDFHA